MTNATTATIAGFSSMTLVAWTYAAQTFGIPAPIAEQEALFRSMLCGEYTPIAKS